MAKTAAAVETRPPAPATVKAHGRVAIARAIVAARIAIRTGIADCYMTGAATAGSAAVEILLADGQEGLLALCGVNRDGIDQAETQLCLGLKHRGPPARQEDCADSRSRASSRADGRACTPVRGGTDQSAEPSCCSDGSGVLAMRSPARALPKLSENGELAAIHDGEVRQLDSQFGGALDSASFANFFYFPDNRLATAGHNPAIHDKRVFENGGKLVADLVAIRGKKLIDACHKDCSGGYVQRGREGLTLWSGGFRLPLPWVLSVGWVLPGPVVRIGGLVGVLRGVSWLRLRILRWRRRGALLRILLFLRVRARAKAECKCQSAHASQNGIEAPRLRWVAGHDLFSLDLMMIAPEAIGWHEFRFRMPKLFPCVSRMVTLWRQLSCTGKPRSFTTYFRTRRHGITVSTKLGDGVQPARRGIETHCIILPDPDRGRRKRVRTEGRPYIQTEEKNMAEPTYEELKAKIAEMEKQGGGRRSGSLEFRVGEKGGVSVYGLGRFPVTLYYEQWVRLLEASPQLRTFLEDNKAEGKLKLKEK